jgi:hypothetical protein
MHDGVVHGAAEGGMGMKKYGNWRTRRLGVVITGFNAAGWAVKYNFRHPLRSVSLFSPVLILPLNHRVIVDS